MATDEQAIWTYLLGRQRQGRSEKWLSYAGGNHTDTRRADSKYLDDRVPRHFRANNDNRGLLDQARNKRSAQPDVLWNEELGMQEGTEIMQNGHPLRTSYWSEGYGVDQQ